MPPPSELPSWTTTLVNRVKPVAGSIASGFLYAQRVPPKWFNWLFGMICDWIAWFKDNTCDVITTTLTADGTYTVPAGCQSLDIICVACGEIGGNGGVNTGGNGGRAGEIVSHRWVGTIPASLEVVVGINGRSSWVRVPGSHTVVYAAGGGVQDFPADMTAASLRADQPAGAPGGVGGSSSIGGRGKTSGQGNGGAGGATNAVGQPGRGYGAGGGGGRQASGSNAGGGGGGGGYGGDLIASPGSNATGGIGAPGVVIFRAVIRNTAL